MCDNETCCITGTCSNGTCPPEYININGNNCRDLFSQVCINVDDIDVLYDNWSRPFCENFVKIYTSSGQNNLNWIREQMYILINKIFLYNHVNFTIPKPSLLNNMQNKIYDICLNYPSSCSNGLYNICSSFNRDSAYGNASIINFCGCHMSDIIYSTYQNLYGISKACDPICSRTTTIQETTRDGKSILCLSNVCIIDNINITITNSNNGDINFYQACGGCTPLNNCDCIINNVDIVNASSKMGDINFSQKCQANLQCYNLDNATGNYVKIPCYNSEGLTNEQAKEKKRIDNETQKLKKRTSIFFLIIIILFIIVFIIIIIGYQRLQPYELFRINYYINKET